MSGNIDEIIDKLCNKFNVSTAYLISEFTKLHVVQCAMLIIISLIMFGFLFYITPKVWAHDQGEEDSAFIIVSIFTGIIFGAIFIISLYILISWFSSPTAMTIKTILNILKS